MMDRESKIILGFLGFTFFLSILNVIGIAFFISSLVYSVIIFRQYIMTRPIDESHHEIGHSNLCGGCTLKI